MFLNGQFPTFVKKPESIEKAAILYKSSRVKEFDPGEHEVVHETRNHSVYKCPFCIEVRGKADEEGKFYWSNEKLISYCFKCETVGILKTDKPGHLIQFDLTINSFLNSLSHSSEIMERELSFLHEINYTKIAKKIDSIGETYLENRNPLYTEMNEVFQFGIVGSMGVTVPIVLNKKIISYCLRFYNPTSKMKYYLPENAKVLYSPNQSIIFGQQIKEVTLVEGTFDAIAASIDGFPTPLAVFGKTITPLQIYILRKISPEKINIYMDETDLSLKFLNKVKRELPTVSEFKIIRSDGKDAEERLNWKLVNKNEEYLSKLLENITNLKDKYECAGNSFIKCYQ